MSTDSKNLCAPAIAAVSREIIPYLKLARHLLAIEPYIFKTNAAGSKLALLSAIYASESSVKFVIKTDRNMRDQQAFVDEINAWCVFLGVDDSWLLIDGELSEQEKTGDIITDLSSNMHKMLFFAGNRPYHYVVPAKFLTGELPGPEAYKKMCVEITAKENITMNDLTGILVKNGYVRQLKNISGGSIRVRGEQIDVSHPILSGYYTFTFYGNKIESIVHHLDRRSKTIDHITLPPVKFPDKTSSWQKILNSSLVFQPVEYAEYTGRKTITYNSLQPDEQFPFTFMDRENPSLKNSPCYAIYSNRDRLYNYFADQDSSSVRACPSPLAEFPVGLATENINLISERWLFPISSHKQLAPVGHERAMELIGHLTPGAPAVHADHGIGIYEGLQLRTIERIKREYLILRYAEGDSLSVPVEFAHKVTAYSGESAPKITRLGGVNWQKTKKQAKHDAELFAKDLLSVAAARSKNTRPSYYIDQQLEEKLHDDFAYALTEDQERTWQEILEDLKSEQPMDRLIVGDVGFGKTEMAVRAAAHAVNNNKQVAVLAPTTLLVQQHFDTFKQRLSNMNKLIGLLSRLASSSEQKNVRSQIESGRLSILIGTHALISKSTRWKNLGLIIIDEEQRFGVRQKEHFKKIRSTVDTLSLSATPIPRTLSMSLSGLRRLSVISTPPQGRKDIHTIVKRDSDRILNEALSFELQRKGQVYLVAPTIRQLPSLRERVKMIAPSARTAIAHGQLSGRELSEIMKRFDKGEIDVLVSSSIVENGLDLPNANTLIVCRATNFGLSELYQLRGRVGRRHRQGRAYFLYDRDSLSAVQKQRLAALTESARLGSGWALARRDLEIRGAGNLLGAEQSGSVNAVGVQLYLDMVRRFVENHDRKISPANDVDIRLPLPSILPASYISDSRERTRYYQRLTRADSLEKLEIEFKNLKKRYGKFPRETSNLKLILTLQRAAGKCGITRIFSSKISPPDEDPYDRLELKAKNLPQALKKLGSLGNWVVRGDYNLTWDIDAITPDLIQKMIDALNDN